jgi:hypothetical protein
MPIRRSPGCKCCGVAQGIIIKTWGENGLLFAGAPVVIDNGGGGSNVVTGSTDGTGTFSYALSAGVPYDIKVGQGLAGKTSMATSNTTLPVGVTTLHVLLFNTSTHPIITDATYGDSGGMSPTWFTQMGTSGISANIPACGSCPAASGVPISHQVNNGFWIYPDGSRKNGPFPGQPTIQCRTLASTGCPQNAPLLSSGLYTIPTSQIIPATWSFSGSISISWNITATPSTKIYCTSGGTITFHQP